MRTDTHPILLSGATGEGDGRHLGERDLLDLLTGALSDGVVVLDREHRVQHANAAGEGLLGDHGVLVEGRVAAFGGCTIETILDRAPGRPRADLHLVARSGSTYRVSGLRISGNAEVGGLLLFRDVTTERRAAERLERNVRLAAGVAHDVSNLLQGIGALGEAMQRRLDLAPRTRADVATIVDQTVLGARTVRQLVDLGRPDPPSRHPIDLGQLLRDQWPVLDRVPTTVGLELTVPAGGFPVLAAPVLLQQMVANLVLNARDAVPKGGHIQVSLRRLNGDLRQGHLPAPVQSGGWLELRVEDDGYGMSPETRARAFEPFFTTKPRGVGSGLGLAQVHEIVEQHGGHVALDSRPGQGTVVSVFLPALESGS